MKFRQALPTIMLALSAMLAAEESTIRFANQDILTGTPALISPDTVLWNSDLLSEPASFHLDKILDLTLPGVGEGKTKDHVALVTLTNGDTIRGQLASVTDEIVTLDTWFAGRLNFNRVMVSSVVIEESEDSIYRGPTGLDGWVQSSDPPVWSFKDSAFRSSDQGGIARDKVLTDECSVSFEAAWKGDSIRLRVLLFSDKPESDNPSSGYEVSFQRGSVHLRNLKSQSFIGSVQSQALMQNDRVRIEIRASRKSNKVALSINGSILEVWDDPDGLAAATDNALHFVSSSALPLRISNIRITHWDGVIGKMPPPQLGFGRFRMGNQDMDPPPARQEDPKEDAKPRMQLTNGDSLTGEIISIHDGLITIKTTLGDVKLPVSRLRTLTLKPVEQERTIRRNGDVRAWFPDGSSLVFRLDASSDGTLTGSSQNFGSATFQKNAFNRIEFNIYSRQYETLRSGNEW